MSAGTLRKIHSIQVLVLLISLGCCQKREYLQSTVRGLKNLRNIQSLRRADLADVNLANSRQNQQDAADKRIHFGDDAPPLSLTKGELTNLYEQSLTNGHTVKFDAGNDEYIHAAVHELDDSNFKIQVPNDDDSKEDDKKAEENGYYYYYYPINSFLGDSDTHAHQVENFEEKPSHPVVYNSHKPDTPVQAHWHTHQHNITITKEKKDPKKFTEKLVEPLFMAVSGFLGMALMTFLTTILMPKHDIKNTTSKTAPVKKKENPDSLDELARFALNALDGRCAERFACEMTKTARSFNIEDNRFFKLLRRLVPGGTEMEKAKYLNQQLKCTAIPCTKVPRPTTQFYLDDHNTYFDRREDYYDRNNHYFDTPHQNNNYNYNQNRRHQNNNYFDINKPNRKNTQQKKNNNQNKNGTNKKKNNQNKNNNNNSKKKNVSSKKNNNNNKNKS